jgi:hypothetical protein
VEHGKRAIPLEIGTGAGVRGDRQALRSALKMRRACQRGAKAAARGRLICQAAVNFDVSLSTAKPTFRG